MKACKRAIRSKCSEVAQALVVSVSGRACAAVSVVTSKQSRGRQSLSRDCRGESSDNVKSEACVSVRILAGETMRVVEADK